MKTNYSIDTVKGHLRKGLQGKLLNKHIRREEKSSSVKSMDSRDIL
jgi:hypothetical protein